MSEVELLSSIYDILQQWQSLINLITGCIQVCIVFVVMYVLYKFFNLFF